MISKQILHLGGLDQTRMVRYVIERVHDPISMRLTRQKHEPSP
ncbi:hypothetical protein BH23THE1_BH23THE1_28830 [soil metagenome]